MDTTTTFFSQYKALTYPKKHIIISPNTPLTYIYYIIKGKVRMYTVTENGDEVTSSIFTEGTMIPLQLILAKLPSTYYFVANTDCVLVKAPTEDVLRLLQENPDILLTVTSRFADAIGGLLKRIETLVSFDAKRKIENLLMYLADKFAENTETERIIPFEMRHEDIGNWLGLSRETVTRQLDILKKENKLYIKKRKIHIPKTSS